MLKGFIAPMLNYLLPLLIAFAGGRAVHGYRGGVIGTVATMGAIISSDITMFIGAMIMVCSQLGYSKNLMNVLMEKFQLDLNY